MGLVRQSCTYLLGRGLPAAIGLGSVAMYSRLLDPASVGAYALVLSASLLASGAAFSWLRVAALRLASQESELHPDLATTIVLAFAVMSLAVGTLEAAGLAALYRPALAAGTLALAAAAAVTSAWYELNATLLQARLAVVSWGVLNLVRALMALAASVLLILAGFKTNALLCGFVLGNLATIMVLPLWRPVLGGRFDRSRLQRLFAIGWSSSVSALLGLASPAIQRYMLLLSAGAAAVGVYAVSQDFASQTMLVLIGSSSLAGIPLAFRAHDTAGSRETSRQLKDNARIIFAVALPAAVGLAALASPLAHVFLGPKFRAGAEVVMSLIALSTLLAGLRIYYFDQAFFLAMQTRPQATVSGISTVAIIVSSMVFIPRYAAVGAALSSLVGSCVGVVLSAAWGMRMVHMPIPMRSWLKTGLAAAGMAIAIRLVPERAGTLNLLAIATLGSIVYAALAIGLRPDVMRAYLRPRFGARIAWLHRS